MRARYRVDTETSGIELVVTALGTEAKAGAGGGRQWQIVVGGTGRPRDSEITLTPKGQELMQAFNTAAPVAQDWLSRVGRHWVDRRGVGLWCP